ncbi:hypothetical protein PENTCL1PPCAC_17357 [Pristionchus entomophagus]|uniref:Uncharacterized protein n=1 Tax=Pristionchus entomophagus TaxID=358040 RepID=A0AAV5TLP5_9BILA|nr:hypothetical protein PENTCL1PPCAC_17357 [Pristionchus entomophagus]
MLLPSLIILSLISLLVQSDVLPPKVIIDGPRTIHDYNGIKIEVLEQIGMEPEYLDRVEKAIVDNFTTDKIRTGDASLRISNAMERRYGGRWTVVLIEDPYLMYTTIPKRSTAHALFDVNGSGVFVGREGWPKQPIEWKGSFNG